MKLTYIYSGFSKLIDHNFKDEKLEKIIENFQSIIHIITHDEIDVAIESLETVIDQFKQFFTELNLQIKTSLTYKANIFLNYLPVLNNLGNKLQFAVSRHNQLTEIKLLVIEFNSISNFMLWALINNFRENKDLRNIISANLVSKLLIGIEKYNDFPDHLNYQSSSFYRVFSSVFNYYQTSAGIYTSAITYLEDLDASEIITFANKAFYFHEKIINTLENIELNLFVDKITAQADREPFNLLLTIHWPLISLLDLTIHLHQKLGQRWYQLIDPRNLIIPREDEGLFYLTERVLFLVNRFQNYIDTNMPSTYSDKETLNGISMILSVISRLLNDIYLKTMDTRILESYVRDHLDDLLEDHYSQMNKFTELRQFENTYNQSIATTFYVDALMDLYAIVAVKSIISHNPNIMKSHMNNLESYKSTINLELYPKLDFISIISRLSAITSNREIDKLPVIIEDLDRFNSLVSIIDRNYIAGKIISIIISYYQNECSKILVEELDKLKNEQILDVQDHIAPELLQYLLYLKEKIKGNNEVQPFNRQTYPNIWDLKSWLIPDFSAIAEIKQLPTIVYVPFNLESDKVRY